MSPLLLSILLLFLIAIGMLMGKKVHEAFEDAPPSNTELADRLESIAKDLKRMPEKEGDLPNIDTVKREAEAKAACPDMSQYIKMSEVPCWNCTLP